MQMKKPVSLLLTLVLLLGIFAGAVPSAHAASAAADATLSVDLDPAKNTGEIIHGAAGFLYGVSSEDVPTTNTIVPLKSKILCTKGAVGTEHPYGDALDVAKTFLESGGQQVMMYNSNYYGVFGVTATIEQYCNDLKNYICPAVVAWKNAWKQEHGTPDDPKDNFGKIDIDQAIVYIPINEGTPAGNNFYEAWAKYYAAIKEADPEAAVAGPNSAAYGSQFSAGQSMAGYIQCCADNNCMPDIITWHELQTGCLSPEYGLAAHMRDFTKIWSGTNWSVYNTANKTSGTPKIPQICINEYAEMEYCGVPGRLVNWIARLEDEKITGCLPFWHQANNLNDLAAGANEGNGAWWLYQWYGNMSGTTQRVSSTTSYDKLYGVSTMDEAKRISTTLLGGYTGSIDVQLNNVTKTQTFKNAKYVNVTVQETAFSGFHGAADDTPVILKGVYPVTEDGSVTVTIENALFENAYNVTLTQASETDAAMAGLILKGSSGDVYEAEQAALSGGAAATAASSNPSYYMSGSGNRAVNMPTGAELTYTINVPVDGKYKLEFVYGNGQGTVRNDMNQHDPVNAEQSFSLDGGAAETVTMESTLFQTMTGIKTKYYDLTAGAHTITVKTLSAVDNDMLFHDFVRVSYAGVYGQELPLLNKVYEAELADFNKLLGNADSTVRTETSFDGYSGGGYVTGLNSRSVTSGGGIRFTVVVENSGLYNLSLRYQSASAGSANIYVGNSAVVLNRVNATVALSAANEWNTTTASVYLQKGINVVDIDTSVDAAIDYLRVRETGDSANSKTIEAESAIPESMKDRIQTAQSSGASGETYVASIPGAYADPAYLEFKYNAPAAGSYQMQVFHSNEDLAGSHSYNIKVTDKYAVFEVNGQSDSPKFEPANAAEGIAYFVDCGDHDPSTVSSGDALGTHNSVTDQIYGADSETGYSWGVVLETAGEKDLGWEGGSQVRSESDKAVYTTYQRALSNNQADLADGKSKTETFRYAHGQDGAGISPRYVSYQFELEPKAYDVTVCMGNSWGNAANPTVTLSTGDSTLTSHSYTITAGSNASETLHIDLTNAAANANGKVDLKVKATSNDATIQMNYILISAATGSQPAALPGGYLADASKIPGSVYLGKLTADVPWMIDYRNLKTATDRYFFMNTFSDDTFREKTITLKLQAGENTIRVYNDNSWHVTYGGTQWLPATTWVRNETPNFDKFVITPMALTQPITQAAQYNVSVMAGQGGKAISNKNVVEENGSYEIVVYPDAGMTDIRVLVNGVQYTPTAQNGSYVVSVSNVTSDQTIGVYFSISDTDLSELLERFKALTASDYTTNSWSDAAAAAERAEALISAENPAAWEITDAYQRLSTALDELVKKAQDVVYFVDCGDHDPSTVSGKADDFGRFNSATDQIYGADSKTGYSWGVVLETAGEEDLGWRGGSWHQYESDKAVYTTYQRALSNDPSDFADGKSKTETFRYAHGQDSAGINPRYISYQFELEPKEYDVTVCMGNSWNNAANPTATLSTGSSVLADKAYTVANGSNTVETLHVDLRTATPKDNGRVDLKVKATSNNATIQMNYIVISETYTEHQHVWSSEWTYDVEHHWHECTAAGCDLADNSAKDSYAEHSWDDGFVSIPATENKNGEKAFTCEVCNTTKTEIIPALGHQHSAAFVAGKDATCTQPGTREHWHCEGCGQNFSDEGCQNVLDSVTIPAEGHKLDHVDRVEPTTEADGNIEYWVCSKCGSKFKDADGMEKVTNVTIPKLDKPSNPIIPILPILSGNAEAKFPFKDVSKTDWYYDSVLSAWKNNLIDGVTATEFRPDSTLTVAQAIKLAAALHQLEHLGKVTLSNGSPWYSSYVEYAIANDIIEKAYQNYTDAQMNAPVTRGEFVHIFHGAESAYTTINTVADNAIPDVKVTDKYAAEIYEFYRAGILTGSDAKGTFHPASSIKRSEVSAILVRMFDTAFRQSITLK